MHTNRQRILESNEKVRLIEGKPGVGKTWFGCELAKYELEHAERGVQSHQKILFLTFARNAVARIRQAFVEQNQLNPDILKKLDERLRIDTFAGFFFWLASSYGRYTKHGSAKHPWLIGSKEVEGLNIPQGHEGFTFDQLEHRAYETIQIRTIRQLIGDLYPLIIIDEFQDVHNSLFEIVLMLGSRSKLVLLRGPGQCIYRNLHQCFDPKEILKLCKEKLCPEEFFLEPIAPDKQRYCSGIQQFLNSYYNGRIDLRLEWPICIHLIPRLNTHRIKNSLESFTNHYAHKMSGYLRKNHSKSSIAILASTNAAVSRIYKSLVKKEGCNILVDNSDSYTHIYPLNASLLFGDNIFMQYGRLILSLLPSFWISKNGEVVNSEDVLRTLVLFFKEKDPNKSDIYTMDTWRPLAEILTKKASGFKKSKKSDSWQDQLKSNLDIINKWLRKTKENLQKELSINGSTPFRKDDIPLLGTITDEFIKAVESSVDSLGRLDVEKARILFEKNTQQNIIFEKLGIQKSIQVMTIHKSKGREFDGVILVLEDDHSAIWKKSGNIEEIEDLYRVAISRAKNALAIVAFDDAVNEAADPVKRLLPMNTTKDVGLS